MGTETTVPDPDVRERIHRTLVGYVVGAAHGAAGQGRRFAADDRPGPDSVTVAATTDALLGPDPAPTAAAVLAGIVTGADPVERLVDACCAALAGRTDASDVLAGACAVATAVGLGVAGGRPEQQSALAMTAADLGGRRGRYVPGADVATRLGWAQALATRAEGDPLEIVALLVGSGATPQEHVPAAFALVALHDGDVLGAARAAARLGGESVVIGGIAGALAGLRWSTGADGAATLDGATAGRLHEAAAALGARRDADPAAR